MYGLTYTDHLQTTAEELVGERAYEEALEDGEIGYLHATRIDPGCYDRELDIEVSPLELIVGDDESVTGEEIEARVTVSLGKRTLFTGTAGFHVRFDGHLTLDTMEAD